MNLYQLRDREDHNWGIIDTDAREETVKSIWSRLLSNKLTQTERLILAVEGYYIDDDKIEQLISLLRASRYDVERVWLTEINPE